MPSKNNNKKGVGGGGKIKNIGLISGVKFLPYSARTRLQKRILIKSNGQSQNSNLRLSTRRRYDVT